MVWPFSPLGAFVDSGSGTGLGLVHAEGLYWRKENHKVLSYWAH